jgi:diaminopimelate epimerase
MHGQGNDFVVLDGIGQQLSLDETLIRKLADRHFGVGCDQVLVVEAPTRADCDFRYRIFNADGGEVEQCGNGARCFADFVRFRGLTDKRTMRVETLGGVIEPRVEPDGRVTVDMGAPRFEPAAIPFLAPERALRYVLEAGGQRHEIGALSMGNPHAVLLSKDVEHAPVTTLGPLIENHTRFPRRTNVGFLEVVDRSRIRLRVWERGAGETLACGTGACAAVVTGIQWGLLDASVRVTTNGGELTVTWQGGGSSVMMSGTTTRVFSGEIQI